MEQRNAHVIAGPPRCDCGCAAVYGESTAIHANWCSVRGGAAAAIPEELVAGEVTAVPTRPEEPS